MATMIQPSIDFGQLERVSRRALRLYDLTSRERDICEVIIDLSFGAGRESVVIPELQAFVDLTGLDKADVSRALQLLEARGVIQKRGPRIARVYAFIPSAAFWREKKPRFDVERAVARAVELERINEAAPAVEPGGQHALPLPADPPDLDAGMLMAARDDVLGVVGESPIGESPISGAPITRAPGLTEESTTVQNVLHNVAVGNSPNEAKRFRDEEKNWIFERLEDECCRSETGRSDFERYLPAWINRVRNCPAAVRDALGDLKMFRSNPRNKLQKPAGAWIYQRAKAIARAAGKEFRML